MKAHRLVVLAAAGAALVLLSGCGTQGGSAITVDGTSYTRSDVDLFTDFQCDYLTAAGAAGGQVPALSRQDARSQSASFLVSTVLGQQVVDEAGATPDEAQVQQAVSQLKQVIDKAATGEDRKRLTDLITEYLRSQIGVQGVVVDQLGGEDKLSQLDQQAASQAVQQGIAAVQEKAAEPADIDVDPVYGLDPDGLQRGEGGSLSVPVSKFAKSARSGTADPTWLGALPKNQRCAG